MTEINVPKLGESVSEATVAKWLKKVGEAIAVDDPLVELETDKVTLEVNATEAGVLAEISVKEGENVAVGALLGKIASGSSAAIKIQPQAEKVAAPAPAPVAVAPAPVAAPVAAPASPVAAAPNAAVASKTNVTDLSPAVKKLVDTYNLNPAQIPVSGKDGRLTKEDVMTYIRVAAAGGLSTKSSGLKPSLGLPRPRSAEEERQKMSRLRQRIAERLKDAQETAAMLTTFNEVDMSAVMALRNEYKDHFFTKHNVKLGFMSFFVNAVITALKEIPAVNAEIDGTDIIYKNYYDIGVAVGTPQGLVVPVVRNADQLNIAGLEKAICALGVKARDGKLSMEDLSGGTFTISNGGVYGSLMSTPILNPPQSGILGMHKIQDRPMVINGKVEVRPMMYLALSYDHRIIDGKEAVSFLVRVKECIEDPQRLLLNI